MIKGFKDAGKGSIAGLLERVEEIKNQVGKTPSIKAKLEAAKAADEMKRLEQITKTTKDIVSGLTREIIFFGDESRVAAVSQQLMAAGVTDLTKGAAAAAINLAKMIDKHTAIKKQQTDYNAKVKEATDHMRELRESAAFEMKFTDPTKLDNFNNWVLTQIKNLKGLKDVVEQTRRAIENAVNRKNFRDASDAHNTALAALGGTASKVAQTIKGPLVDALQQFSETARFSGMIDMATGFDKTSKIFAEGSKRFIDRINWIDEHINNIDLSSSMIYQARKEWTAFLQLFKDEKGFNLGTKGPAKISQIQDAFIKLSQVLKSAEIPEQIKLINAEIKELHPPLPAWTNFFETLKEKFSDMKKSLPSIKESIGVNLIDSINRIGDVFANAVNDWDGTAKGFFKNLAQGFKQLVQQILSELIRLMVIRAVMQIIGAVAGAGGGGDAAHGAMDASSPMHGAASGGGSFGGTMATAAAGGGGTFAASPGPSINNSVSMNIYAQDANSFRNSEQQIKGRMLSELRREENRWR